MGNSFTAIRQSVIAVVDDDPDVRKAIASLLAAFDFPTQEFASAEEFLDAAKTSNAACLIVDIDLGKISGVDMVRRLAAAGLKFPVIFVTGCQDDQIRRQAMDQGCAAYLKKPFRADHLIAALNLVTGSNPDHTYDC